MAYNFGGYQPQSYGYNQPQYFQPYQQPQQPQSQNAQDAFACRPVTSREEAVASPADFMRPLIMPDMAHGMIYVKRFNPSTGASDILDFKQQFGDNSAPALDYVTRQEFDRFCADLMRRITRTGGEDDE